jgi:hypothetical protein
MAAGPVRALRRLGVEHQMVGRALIGPGGGDVRGVPHADRLDHRQAEGGANRRRPLGALLAVQLDEIGLQRLDHERELGVRRIDHQGHHLDRPAAIGRGQARGVLRRDMARAPGEEGEADIGRLALHGRAQRLWRGQSADLGMGHGRAFRTRPLPLQHDPARRSLDP